MDDLVERKLEMLFRDLKPYADKSIGSLRIGMDEVHAILALEARIQALATSLAEAEGRVKAITIALHDAIRRPMGQVPESADPFYSPAMAEQAEARRVARSQALSELAALGAGDSPSPALVVEAGND